MAGSKPKKIKGVFHVLVFIFVLGLIMYFSNFHSFASEIEKTTTGEYDNFTTYYRIADKNNVSMSASDILYSGSEVANILDISKEDITLSKISDGINSMPIKLKKSMINRSGLFIQDNNSDSEIDSSKVQIENLGHSFNSVGGKILYIGKFQYSLNGMILPVDIYIALDEDILTVTSSNDSNTEAVKNTLSQNIVKKENVNNTPQRKILFKNVKEKNAPLKQGLGKITIGDMKISLNKIGFPNSFNIRVVFNFAYIVTTFIGLCFLIYAIILLVSTGYIIRWNKRKMNEVFERTVNRIRNNSF